MAAHIVKEYRRFEGLEIVSPYRADDCTLTSLATGIWPFDPVEHVFRCCPTLPAGIRQLMSEESLATTRLSPYAALLLPPISLDKAIDYCNQDPNTRILYRIREGLDLDQLAQFYEYLLDKIYPSISRTNLVEYARSLPSVKDPSIK